MTIIYRRATLSPGARTGRPILLEVYSFGRRAELEADELSDVGPEVLLGSDRLEHCDEAFVAECSGQIVGTVTLAFNGVHQPKRPTLDALYVLPKYQRQGIGLSLLELAVRRFIELGKVPILCKVESEEMHALIDRLGKRLPEIRLHIDARIDC